ncbi:hypothetical protein FVER14953_21362 [Fusarium verticillioides]|nr:hypothetical protein FVER14953_21362 [Fusarium verticillioides]
MSTSIRSATCRSHIVPYTIEPTPPGDAKATQGTPAAVPAGQQQTGSDSKPAQAAAAAPALGRLSATCRSHIVSYTGGDRDMLKSHYLIPVHHRTTLPAILATESHPWA